MVAVGFITAPTERIGVFFELVFCPTLLGGFIAFVEFVLPILPIRGSIAAGYKEIVIFVKGKTYFALFLLCCSFYLGGGGITSRTLLGEET